MPSPPTSSAGTRNLLVLLLLGVAILLGGLAFATLPLETSYLLLPTLATFVAFALFTLLLVRRVGDGVFGELGFVYVALVVAYTALPALAFLAIDLDSNSRFAQFLPAHKDLGVHLWRHTLFVLGVATGYLLCRGTARPRRRHSEDPASGRTIAFLIAVIASCGAGVWFLSAPVTTYLEHYTRFEHLSWVPLRVAYVCLALKSGGYFVLLTFLFRDFARHRLLALLSVAAICLYELAYSFGSRLETLVVLLGAVCLYHHQVRPVRLRQGALALVAIAALFSVVELFRASEFDLAAAQDTVAAEGAMPAAEFSAVFFTGYHLYTERGQGSLPRAEWPMFLSELIQLTPFVDHTRWNPQYWYARNYFPDAVVPPETIGPIAESAIWGGEIDLVLRSLLNGAFFAYLVRWYINRESRWWAMVIYAYCYATCAMTLKYSVFYQLVPLVKVVLPSILLVGITRYLLTPPIAAGATTSQAPAVLSAEGHQ